MKNIIIGCILLLLSSCYTQEKCYRLFPPQIETRDSIVYRDTIIEIRDTINVPGDSVVVKEKVPCGDFEIKAKSGRSKISVKVKDGVMTAIAECEELKIAYANKVIASWTEKHSRMTKIVEKPIKKKPTLYLILIGILIPANIYLLIKYLPRIISRIASGGLF